MGLPVKRLPGTARVGLALGGGAARGLAHIGVLRALERGGIPVHLVAGTSMGAVVGGAYAATGDVDEVERRIRDFLASEEFQRTRLSFLQETKQKRGGLLYSVGNLVRRGIVYGMSTLKGYFVSAERFAEGMRAVLPDVRIEEMPLPFCAVALDIEVGQEVWLREGPLREAVAASAAIPGLLPPVRGWGRTLVDGGWIDKVPVLTAHGMGADLVIAVDISAELDDLQRLSRGMDLILRATAIRDAALVRMHCRFADCVLRPAVGDVHWADFAAADRCIAAGQAAVEEALPTLRRWLRRARWLSWIRPTLARRMAALYLRQQDGCGAAGT